MTSGSAGERNWSGTYAYRAQTVHQPGSVPEVQQLIRRGRPLRALGTRHSFNAVADAEELISVARMGGGPVIDETARTVAVPAGMRYGDLAPFLETAGWALANLASLPHISIAGSVATATHGSGNDNPSLASAVASMTLVTGTGDLVTLDRTHPDFAGAVVHLGALGVVTELILDIEPSYAVRQDVYEHLPWAQLTDRFGEVMGAGYSVSAITNFAEEDVDLLWVKSRVTDPQEGQPDQLFGARAAREKLHMTRGNDPRYCTPQLGEPGRWCDRLPHFLLEFTPSSGAEIQSEWLLDRQYAAAVVEALRGLGEQIAPLIKSAEIRTIAADQLWLSPAYERDVFGVHFTWQPDAAAVAARVALIEEALAPFRPRPHWAKVFGAGHDWPALYPRLAAFQQLAAAYDPSGVFRNDFLARTVLA